MNHRNFLRKTVILLTVGLFLLSVIGFSEGQKEKLVWAEWWNPEWGEETIEWIVTSFEEEHPGVDVEPLFIPHDQFSDELLTLCQAGDCPALPPPGREGVQPPMDKHPEPRLAPPRQAVRLAAGSLLAAFGSPGHCPGPSSTTHE